MRACVHVTVYFTHSYEIQYIKKDNENKAKKKENARASMKMKEKKDETM